MSQLQINFLEKKLETEDIKNVYKVKNKLKTLKKKAIKDNYQSFRETKE